MTALKNYLRKEYRARRVSVEDRENKEKLIAFNLFSLDFFKSADCIFLYCAHDGEINTDMICDEAEKLGIKTAYPYCEDRYGLMEFYFASRKNLIKGMYGIYEPDKEKSQKAVFTENSLCIVPGVTFGKKGERLGYGKGYYDRFLSSFRGKKLALSFEECLSDEIPMEAHDIKIDYLITDKEIYKIF